MVNRLFNTDITVSGVVYATTGTFATSLTISGSPVLISADFNTLNSKIVTTSGYLQSQIGAPDKALVGADGVTVTSGINVVTISGFRSEFVLASGSLQTQINATVAPKAIVGAGTVTVTSGTNTITISSPQYVPQAIIGSGAVSVISGTNTVTIVDKAIVGGGTVTVTSGTSTITVTAPQYVPTNLAGTDGITVLSGTPTVTVSGFRSEFVLASGSLQTQINTKASTAELLTVSGFLQNQINTFSGTSASFINQTSVTLTHNFNTMLYTTTVLDASGFYMDGALQQLVNSVTASFNQGQTGSIIVTR